VSHAKYVVENNESANVEPQEITPFNGEASESADLSMINIAFKMPSLASTGLVGRNCVTSFNGIHAFDGDGYLSKIVTRNQPKPRG